MSKLAKTLSAAAGNAGGDNLFPEDVFSTFLYQGNSSSPPTITNNIDLSGEGGLVWIKARTGVTNHVLTDTVRGAGKELSSDVDWAQQNYTGTYGINSFNNNGFSLVGANAPTNTSAYTYTSWSFRKAKGFCDIVTYTGNGTAGRTVAHNLGSVPKMMIVKNTTTARSWAVYHSGLGGTKDLALDDSGPAQARVAVWNDTNPTSSVFTVGSGFLTNTNGDTYVAYLFGDDAIFGEGGDERICQMSRYLGTGSNGNAINVGFEPQWVLWKPDSGTGDWQIVDSMRGWTADGVVNRLEPNTTDAEAQSGSSFCNLTSTGFVQNGSSGSNNASGIAYMYMAIRRPMKVPTAGTEVYKGVTRTGNTSNFSVDSFGFSGDLMVSSIRNTAGYGSYFFQRLLGSQYLRPYGTNAEASGATSLSSWDMEGFSGLSSGGLTNDNNVTYVYNMFKRASKFMDVVAYTPDGTGNATAITHNLTVTPEMMIVKRRDGTSEWFVYHSATGNTKSTYLNYNFAPDTGNQFWNNTSPTATQFTAGSSLVGGTMIAFLFATLDGISKVGSYTGTGSDLNVDCGFSAGARFILIKRTDATGDWYVWDSARGIVAGNDPYLLLNTTAAEVTNTDYIDPRANGFTVTSSAPAGLNAGGGTYIFLAIA